MKMTLNSGIVEIPIEIMTQQNVIIGKNANGILCDEAYRVSKTSFASECHKVPQVARKYNFIYDHKESTAFPVPITVKLKKFKHSYV